MDKNLVGTSSGPGMEMIPGVRMVGMMTVRALDSLPLPVLAIIFIACLALLQWPMSQSPSSILPTFTPPTLEKDRLSPSPFTENPGSKPLFVFTPLPTTTTLASSTSLLTSAQAPLGSTPQTYSVNVYNQQPGAANVMVMGGQQQQLPLPLGRNTRRGSKQLREYRLGLGVVPEVEGESLDRTEVV
ncbi:hypothetical protein IAR55_005225 [Kwoniella newhampshirensis]|uniref:Uncharacterized protein n=1 Tax=Kwoniella newhampshirensis TaxID=1651941 RepID=A0AAW0YYW3_9TREE